MKIEVIVVIFSCLIFALSFGNLSGFVVYDDSAEIDERILLALEEDDNVRVIAIKKDTVRKGLRNVRVESVFEALAERGITPKENFEEYGFAVIEVSRENVNSLKNNNKIKRFELDEPTNVFLDSNAPLINSRTSNSLVINGEAITGKGVSVCVLDTGIDYTHNSLGGCTSAQYLSGDCEKVIGGYDFVNNNNDPMDDNWHGTHVSGIIAGDGIVLGVAPDAKLVGVKIFNSGGGGFLSHMVAGINWCVTNKDVFNISAISISGGSDALFSSYCDSQTTSLRDAVNNAHSAGLSVVAATGNDGSYTSIASPACITNSIPVTNTVGSSSYNSGANRGANFPGIIAAPGTDIISAFLNNNRASATGTSMSTPFVSGAIALYQQASLLVQDRMLGVDEIKELINNHGNGLLDSQTGMTYKFVQTESALLELAELLENNLHIVSLSVNSSSVVLGNSLNLSWSSSSNQGHVSSLMVAHEVEGIVFSSSNVSGSVILGSNYLNHTGLYVVSLNVSDDDGFVFVNESFFVKKIPSFQLFVNGSSSNISGFPNYYNLSAEFVDVDLDAFSLFLNSDALSSFNDNVFLDVGEYVFFGSHEETSVFFESNKSLIITISSGAPSILNVSPSDSFINILENKSMIFSYSHSNPSPDEISTLWILNNSGTLSNSTSEDFLFNATGLSGIINLTLIISNNYGSDAHSWLINVSRIPISIISVVPSVDFVEFEKKEAFNFSVGTSNSFGRIVSYDWRIFNDSINLSLSNSSFAVVNSDFEGFGNYSLSVLVSDGFSSDSHVWSLSIIAEPSILGVSPSDSLINILENESMIFSYSHSNPSPDEISTLWILNNSGTLSNSTSEDFLFNATGLSGIVNLTLIISNNYGSDAHSWLINVSRIPISVTGANPSSFNLVLDSDELKDFSISTSNSFGRLVSYDWRLVNSSLNVSLGTSASLVFNSSMFTKGNYSLFVFASDGFSSDFHAWSLNINPEPFIALALSFSNVSEEVGSSVSFNLEDYFYYYLFDDATPSYELVNFNVSNNTVSYTINNGVLLINTSLPFEEFVRVRAFFDSIETFSNVFKVSIREITPSNQGTEETSPPSPDGGAPSPGGASPSMPSSTPSGDTVQTDDDSDNVSSEDEEVNDRNYLEPDSNLRVVDEAVSVVIRKVSELVVESVVEIQEFQGKIYEALVIEKESDDEGVVVFEFSVSNSWFVEEDVLPEDIALHRFNGSWVELPTRVLNKEDNHTFYESSTQSFSYFIIGTKSSSKPVIDVPGEIIVDGESDDRSYLFIVVVSFLVVVLVVVLFFLGVFKNNKGKKKS